MKLDFGESPHTILVALDFDRDGELLDVGRECVREALEVAGQKVSTLLFVHVFDVPESLRLEVHSNGDTAFSRHYQKVRTELDKLVGRAKESGTQAHQKILFGTPWLRLIQAVIKEDANLLIAGTGRPGSLWKALLGSTTMKLLRKCPCTVWVTKSRENRHSTSILVAHDLKEVGSKALAWGAKLARERRSPLVVLHVLDGPEFGRFWSSSAMDRKEKRDAAQRRIQNEIKGMSFSHPVEIIVEEGSPATLIHHYLQLLPVGLLVMGTVARTGVSGFLTGNTAETLLPWVACSLVAVKPNGFVTPVQAESEGTPVQGFPADKKAPGKVQGAW